MQEKKVRDGHKQREEKRERESERERETGRQTQKVMTKREIEEKYMN